MTTEETLHRAAGILENWTMESNTPEEGRLDVVLAVKDLLPAVEALMEVPWGYLASITALDFGPEENRMECLYHFCKDAAVLGLRLELGRNAPVVPSVCGLIPSASFFERELSEMFGINVEGTPVPEKLFLPDDWPDGVYPLRKDFDIRQISADKD
ncbi:MAG: NADH-quinone oxidoreductase subunit C [Anaerolineales bacterium]|nr:NADH-quinone oxidoreductase subunit C [Anaerolineales bacterium]